MTRGDSSPVPLSDYRLELFYRILESRIEMKKPTWISCNVLSKDQLIASTNGRIADRCAFQAVTVFFNWASFRKPFQDGCRSHVSANYHARVSIIHRFDICCDATNAGSS